MKDKNIEIEEIIKEHFKNLNICSFEYKGENEKGELVVEVSLNYKLIKDKLIEIEEILHSEKSEIYYRNHLIKSELIENK